MKKHQIVSIFRIAMYVIGAALVLFGIGLVLVYKDIERDIGFFLITFCSALMLMGFKQKQQ